MTVGNSFFFKKKISAVGNSFFSFFFKKCVLIFFAQSSLQYLFMEIEFVDFWQDPAHTPITSAHQYPEVVKLLKQAQTRDKKDNKLQRHLDILCVWFQIVFEYCVCINQTKNVCLLHIQTWLPHPRCGPPFTRSKTWAGLSNCLKRRRNFTPWLSPLLELTKTRRGLAHEGGHVAFQKPMAEWLYLVGIEILQNYQAVFADFWKDLLSACHTSYMFV